MKNAKITTPRHLKRMYSEGANITSYLRKEHEILSNTPDIIEIAYDLQAGSYIASMASEIDIQQKQLYTSNVARVIRSLCAPVSLLEAGVGEGVTFSGVIKHLDLDLSTYGFDISWSRIAHARKWLETQLTSYESLCVGSLLDIPFRNNSIDVVYTTHSIEPNSGNEEAILRELYRVTGRYLLLLEPAYELVSNEIQSRMDAHGYCKNLPAISKGLGYNIIDHGLFPYGDHPLNPTALTIIKKSDWADSDGIGTHDPSDVLACPLYKTRLIRQDNVFYSPEALSVYPIIDDIPCLRIDAAIFASQFEEFVHM